MPPLNGGKENKKRSVYADDISGPVFVMQYSRTVLNGTKEG